MDPGIEGSEAMVRLGGTMSECQAAKKELRDFAEKTYNALMSEQPGSSLSFMCRLDIAVMMNAATQRFEYFVNEIERGNLICIFGMITRSPYRFGDETREVVLKYLDKHLGEM